MSDGTDPLADLLRRHDRPVAPDRGFADRLEARLLAELGPAAAVSASRSAGSALVPVQARPRRLDAPALNRRPRWFDIAAAAVLLIGLMGGGILGQLPGRGPLAALLRDDPTRVAAPRLEEPAIMEGGSPARDNRFAGPGPVQGQLAERWSVSLKGEEFIWSARPFEDIVYVLRGGGRSGASLLQARDLSDGAVIWERKSTTYDTAVASEGVVIFESTSSTSPTLEPHDDRVLLLDRTTGDEIWRHDLKGVSGWLYRSPIIVEDTVYVVDADGSASALDLATGNERWISTAGRAVPLTEAVSCDAPAPLCQYGSFAYESGILYLVNAAGEIHALDARTGDAIWSVDLVDRFALERNSVSLLATGTGVVVSMVENGQKSSDGSFGPSGSQRTALLDLETGAEIWTRDGVSDGGEPTTDGMRLYLRVANLPGEDFPCCRILALDLLTGETVWNIDGASRYLLGLVGTTEPDLLAVDSGSDGVVDLAGLDPSTGSERWRTVIGQAYPTLPMAADGTIFASGFRHTFVAYHAVVAQGDIEPAVMEGGSPARDHLLPGPALTPGTIEQRWSVRLDYTGPDGERLLPTVLPFRDLAYVVKQRFDALGLQIEARDLATGAVRWTATTGNVAASPTVSAAGVLVVEQAGVEASEANQAQVTLRMLDLGTGAERWAYALPETTNWNFHGALVAEEIVYYVDADGVAYALDAETGAERWVSTTGRSFATYQHSACVAPVENCRLGGSAFRDGVLYLVNGAAQVYALDARTGAATWSVDVGDRYGLERNAIELLATGRGVVVTMIALGDDVTEGGYGTTVGRRTTLLDRATGDETWTRDDVADESFASADDTRLYLHIQRADATCCPVTAIDLATGKTVWTIPGSYGYPLGISGGEAPVLLRLDLRNQTDTAVVAYDPTSGAELWRLWIGAGTPVLPLAADGTLLVEGNDGSLAAYTITPPPLASPPAMAGGSPAQDRRYPGPDLTPGDLEARWTIPLAGVKEGEYVTSTEPFGDVIYVTIGDGYGRGRLEARRVADGTVLWQRENVAVDPAVSTAGVVTVELDPTPQNRSTPRDTAIVLLDRLTGAELWRYALDGAVPRTSHAPIVVGGAVFYADGETRVHAVDLATGQARWVSTVAHVAPTPIDLDCAASAPPLCGYGNLVYAEGVLYVLTATAQVVAIDADTGAMRWGVDIGERYALKRDVVSLVATSRGVVLSMTEYGPTSSTGEMSPPRAWRTSLLDRADGTEIWTRDDVADENAVVDAERVYVHTTGFLDGCCSLLALDLGTGTTVWEITGAQGFLLGMTGGDAPSLIRFNAQQSGHAAFVAALDPRTGVERWRQAWGDIVLSLPVADDGTVFASEIGGAFRAYTIAPSSPAASPQASPLASPPASPVASPAAILVASPVASPAASTVAMPIP